MRGRLTRWGACSAICWVAAFALAATARAATPFVLDGAVEASVRVGDTLYVGGRFSRAGPLTGPGVVLDAATGSLASPPGPVLSGRGARVDVVAGDGAGGWYVGGKFSRAGRAHRQSLVHIRSDGTLDRRFAVRPDGPVSALALRGRTLYIGGGFRRVGRSRRLALAAVDANTGRLLRWHADVREDPVFGPEIRALAVAGGRVYVGGLFSTVGGARRSGLAALDARTARVESWQPDVRGFVAAIVVRGENVYIGGSYSVQHGYVSGSFGVYDARTGRGVGRSPLFYLTDQSQADVNAIVVTDGAIYLGGRFESVDMLPRANLVALDPLTHQPTSWMPEAGGRVEALALQGGTLYVAGGFAKVGGAPRNGLAALDPVSGQPSAWAPHPNHAARAIAVSDGRVYAGGGFTSVGGETRHRLAAFQARTGELLPWDPDAHGPVYALAAAHGTVFAGGEFEKVGGQPRELLAAIDAQTGAVTPWDARVHRLDPILGTVRALALAGDTLYFGGTFRGVQSVARRHLAAVNATTAAVTPFNPHADDGLGDIATLGPGIVHALIVRKGTVYAGGSFNSIGRRRRPYLAALDAATGAPKRWRPRPNAAVSSLAAGPGAIYAGGDFTRIAGANRRRLAAIDPGSGHATGFNPGVRADNARTVPDSEVNALAVSHGTVYAGGRFRGIGGRHSLRALAALDSATGRAKPLDAGANGTVLSISLDGGWLYVGGSFSFIAGQQESGLAALDTRSGRSRWAP